ncbi:procollagen C-endopeptidase enhancer 2-like [Arapaima gigas]
MRSAVCVGSLCLLFFLAFGWTQGQGHSAQTTNFTRPTFLCGGHLVTDSGYLGSEGFPSHYKPNRKCTWYISVPDGHVVMLSFRIFDLEPDPLCRYDYVEVYNGHLHTAQRLGRFCGTFRPGALISTSNKMMVEMVSDSGTGGRGFLAYFSGGKPHMDEHQFCGGRLTKPQGSIKTPNWPEANYPAGISCSWYISVEPNKLIEVKFDKFDLEPDSYCRYDYVAFFNGGETDDSRRIGKFCGNEVPQNIVTNGNDLLVQFVSDLSVTSDGFMATYTSIPHGSKTPTIGNDFIHAPRVASNPPGTGASSPKPVRPTNKPKTKLTPTSVKPTAKTRAGAKPSPKAKTNTMPKPGTKTIPKLPVKPTSKPKTKPSPKTKINLTPKPKTKSIPKPEKKLSQKPTSKPQTKIIPKPKTKSTSKPGTKIIPKPGIKPMPKPGTKPNFKPGIKTTPKPGVKPKTKVITGVKKPGLNQTSSVVKQSSANKCKSMPVSLLCPRLCKNNSTLQSSFCSSEFVITGKVTAVAPSLKDSASVSVTVIKAYKTGRLSVTQVGQDKTIQLKSTCMKCPVLRRGINYILTGQVDEQGHGILDPSSFALVYKVPHEKLLSSLSSRPC